MQACRGPQEAAGENPTSPTRVMAAAALQTSGNAPTGGCPLQHGRKSIGRSSLGSELTGVPRRPALCNVWLQELLPHAAIVRRGMIKTGSDQVASIGIGNWHKSLGLLQDPATFAV